MASASTTEGVAGSSGTGEWAWWPLKVAGNPWNVSDTMTAWGLWNYYDPNDPLTDIYAQICKAANPGGSFITPKKPNKYGYGHAVPSPEGLTGGQGTDGAWEIFCEMCLRSRLILFCESVIGDCGLPVGPSAPSTGAALGIQAGEKALSFVPIAGPILGTVLGDLSGLLTGAAHAQAVSNEKQVLCAAAAQYSQQIQATYAAFEAGQLDAQGCSNHIQDLANFFKQDVEKITKSCNAACGMIGVMEAHAMLAPYLTGLKVTAGTNYVLATPTNYHPGTTSLDSIPGVGGGSQPTQQQNAAYASSAPSPGPNWILILIVLLAIIWMVS